MDRVHTFVRDEVLASYFENMWDAALSVLSSNFAVTILDATHLRVPASPGVGASVISIQGRPRWVEANVDRAHPGGAAGTYDVFVTAADQSIANAPAPFTDNTNYGFALAIVAAGATPGGVALYRRVASCVWDGAQITELDPVVNSAPAGWPASGPATQATLRKLDQTATGATAGNDPRVPTQNENDALLGTSGASANGNRFVTDQDPRNTNARTPSGAAGGDLGGSFPNPSVLARRVVDARGSASAVADYNSSELVRIKTAGDVGLTGVNGEVAGNVVMLVGRRPWTDDSLGPVHEWAYSSTGFAYRRTGTGGGWGAWTVLPTTFGATGSSAMVGNDARVVGPALKDDAAQIGVTGAPSGTMPAFLTTTSGPVGGPISSSTQAGAIWLSLGGVLVRHVLAATTGNVAGQINPPASDANPAVGSSNVRASTLWVTATGWGQAPTFQWTNSAAFATLTDATITANLGVVSLMNTSVLPPSPGGGAVAIATVWWRQQSGGSYVWYVTVDRRPAALGNFGVGRGSANGTDYSTTSTTTWVPIDTSRMQFRMESNGAPVRVKLKSQGYNSTVNQRVAIGILYDGSIIRATQVDMPNTAGSTQALELVIDDIYQPLAGSHLWTAVFMATSGGGTAFLRNLPSTNTTDPGFPTFSVEEIMKPVANHDAV